MIELTDNLFIKIEQYNYILCLKTKRSDKEGSITFKPLAYCGSIQTAIKAAIDWKIKKELINDVKTLNDAIRIINNVNKEFIDLLNKVLESEE